MIKIFVTATNTDIGKTYVTKQLLNAFSQQGFRVAAFKPIETGVISEAADGSELLALSQSLNPALVNLHVDDITPIQLPLPAAPYVANNAQDINLEAIDTALNRLENLCDIVIIEGAGGLLVPIDSKLMMMDLIKHFHARAVLVSHCELGCINDTLLSHTLLLQHNISHTVVLNCKKGNQEFETVSKPYFDREFPEFFILEDDLDALVDHLLQI
jgi:dethiobiotin synthetase